MALSQEARDKKVADLLAVVEKQKAEIARAERPRWKTNTSFGTNENSNVGVINLQTVTDPDVIIKALAFLIQQAEAYDAAAARLGQSKKFTWMGFSFADWEEDFKTRIDKIQLAAKKKKLEVSEAALNSLISADKRAEMELEKLEKQLGV